MSKSERLSEEELDQMDYDELVAHGKAYRAAHGDDEYLEEVAELVSSLRFFHPDRYGA